MVRRFRIFSIVLSAIVIFAFLFSYTPQVVVEANSTIVESHVLSEHTNGVFGGAIESFSEYGTAIANMGDIDGNGTDDLVVSSQYDNAQGLTQSAANHGAVYIQFMNTDGTIASVSEISNNTIPSEPFPANSYAGKEVINVGDLDGNGVNDIAVGAWGYDGNRGGVFIFYLDNTGTVLGAVEISGLVNATLNTELESQDYFGSSLDIHPDINGDGFSDLIIGAQGDDDGSSNAGALYIINLDGNEALIGITKLSNSGGLPFTLASGLGFGAEVEVIGDLNGDGRREVVVGSPVSSPYTMRVLYIDTANTITNFTEHNIESFGYLDTAGLNRMFGLGLSYLPDMNGDGIDDLAVGVPGDNDGPSTGMGAVLIAYLNSDGETIGTRKISREAGGFTGAQAQSSFFGAGLSYLSDNDGDGEIELVIGASRNSGATAVGGIYVVDLITPQENIPPYITTVSGSGVSNFTTTYGADPATDIDTEGHFTAQKGDFNDDGFMDFATAGDVNNGSSSQPGKVFLNEGDDTFTEITLTDDARSVAIGDFNNDGNEDVVYSKGPSDFHITNGAQDITEMYLGNGQGSFIEDFNVNITDTGNIYSVDINQDGAIDLYIANNAGPSSFWINQGSGVFTRQEVTADNISFYADFGDVNGDGFMDYISNSSTTSRLFYGDSGGTFTLQPGVAGNDGAFDLELRDYNGDGDLDLYMSFFVNDVNKLYFGDGAGTFTEQTFAGSTGGYQSTSLDFDKDSDLDIFVSGDVRPNRLWINDGSGTFTANTDWSVNDLTLDTLLGDFNSDGLNDIIQLSRGGGESTTQFLSSVSSTFDVPENDQAIGIVEVTEENVSDTLSYAITGGADSGDIAIGSGDGVLTFNAVPDFETPTDDNGDNTYEIQVTVTDNGSPVFATVRDFEITVTDEVETGSFSFTQSAVNISESGLGNNRQVLINVSPLPPTNVRLEVTNNDPANTKLCAQADYNVGTCSNLVDNVTIDFGPNYLVSYPIGQAYYVFTLDDNIDQGVSFPVTSTMSIDDANSDAAWSAAPDQTATFNFLDDDNAGYTVDMSSGVSITEDGATGAFNVVLTTQPASDVVIDISSSDSGIATASPSNLTFTNTNWNTPQPVTVTAVSDNDGQDELAFINFAINDAASDDAFDPLGTTVRSVTVIDDDNAGVTVNNSAGITIVENTSTGSFDVVLDIEPQSNVVIDITSSDPGAANALTTQLTFTPSNWNTPQTVQISGVEDDDVADETVIFTFSVNDGLSDDDFDVLQDDTRIVEVTDNDTAELTATPGAVTIDEGDTLVDVIDVVLTTQPLSDVVVEVTLSDTSSLHADASSLIFTTTNWNVAQQITIEALDDIDFDSEMVTVTFEVNGDLSDPDYTTLIDRVVVTVNDGDNVDDDGDGIIKGIEQQVINNGDGNNDGIEDYLQSDVAGLLLGNGDSLILDGNGCDLTNIVIVQESELDEQDVEYEYPNGLVDFTAQCATLTIDLYTQSADGVLRKYNQDFLDVEGASASEVTIDSQGLIKYTYTIVDGGPLDISPAGDGIIRDPVGIGVVSNSNIDGETSTNEEPALIRTGGRN